jgi:hypothetical protein
MANIVNKYVLGTPQTVINTGTDIAATTFSAASGTSYINTSDAAVPYAPYALATAFFPGWGSAPVAGTVVELWGTLQNTDGSADDTDPPSGTLSNGARQFGAFVLAGTSSAQRRTTLIDTMGCNVIDFYMKNGSIVNMNNDAGTTCTLKLTPLALAVDA